MKDESQRFGLRAFKGLGASYAIHRFLEDHSGPHTFCCATDGNHGRAVAWTARRLGHDAVIYIPRHAPAPRVAAIREEGARIVIVDGSYDEAVAQAARDSAANGWQVICDTAYTGYTDIPLWIMSGYSTIFAELPIMPEIVFVQAGVGALAYAAVEHYGDTATIVAVEPVSAACCLESIASPNGERRLSDGAQDSAMDCLNCGIPSLAAWPVLRTGIAYFLAIEDDFAVCARKILAAHMDSGTTGAAGLAGVCAAPDLVRGKRVLVINTEGNVNNCTD